MHPSLESFGQSNTMTQDCGSIRPIDVAFEPFITPVLSTHAHFIPIVGMGKRGILIGPQKVSEAMKAHGRLFKQV